MRLVATICLRFATLLGTSEGIGGHGLPVGLSYRFVPSEEGLSLEMTDVARRTAALLTQIHLSATASGYPI
jgi:hypothetical protein